MDLVFSTEAIERTKRYAAWQGAICDVYVHVDVKSEQRSDYRGFIREARFGAVTMTDVLLSERNVARSKSCGVANKTGCFRRFQQVAEVARLTEG
jgi:hypothetical protein